MSKLSKIACIIGCYCASFIWCNALPDITSPLIPRTVLFDNPEKTAVCVSPDGERLAYLAPVDGKSNIWIKTIGLNDDHPVTHDKKGVIEFYWAKNSSFILFPRDLDGDENWHIIKLDLATLTETDLTPFPQIRASIFATSSIFPNDILISMNKDNIKLFDIYRLNIVTGSLEHIAKNTGNIVDWISDNNLQIRAATTIEQDGGKSLLVRDINSEKWNIVHKWNPENATNSCAVSISADGSSIYLLDSNDHDTRQLVQLDLRTGIRKVVASDEKYDIDSVLLNEETDEPEAVKIHKKRICWKSLIPDLEEDLKNISICNNGAITQIRRTNKNLWVIAFENDNRPRSYYLYDKLHKKTEFLFCVQQNLCNYQLVPIEPIKFTSRDGLIIHGYLARPHEKSAPLVLVVHGGPAGRNIWGFDNIAQWLTNRGYACLQVNFRGSTGYGKKFKNAGNREWGGKMHNDLIDAVNWATNNGIANKNKIAIFGGSYGGYAALVGATFTPDVFCCAIDICGISNLLTFLDSIPPYWETGKARLYAEIGNLITEPEFLKSRSPLFRVDQIKIPILVAHGINDPRVKKQEADQIITALKNRGLPCEYLLFPDEGHGIRHPKNRLALFASIEKFLAKYLGGRYEE